MLVFTNRTVNANGDESAFQRDFQPGATRLGVADVTRSPGGPWTLTGARHDVDDPAALNLLLAQFASNRPVLVYVHGFRNAPADCFARCAELGAMYGVEVIGFSWASEGFLADGNDPPAMTAAAPPGVDALAGVTAANLSFAPIQSLARHYRQAKLNAQDSVDALARFLRLVGTARLHANTQPYTLAVHSLGAHFLQNTLAVSGAAEAVGTATNVAMLAACVRAAGHTLWLSQVRPRGQVFITFDRKDLVLFGAAQADHDSPKLGTDPGADKLGPPLARYVSFNGARTDALHHHYFVQNDMPDRMRAVLTRIFTSERDIRAGEIPRKVYPLGCDEALQTCFMGNDSIVDPG